MEYATIKENQCFDDKKAADKLMDAMKGFGTNEEDIIDVLISHNNKQRRTIAVTYKQTYGEDLVDELKSELSGNLKNAVVALMTEPRLYDARELKRAMAGAGTKESILIEILCSRSNEEIGEIKELYKQEYDKELEEDLMDDASGYFGRMMVSLCTAARKEDECIDEEEAERDAQHLFEAGEGRWGTDEMEFNSILCLRGRCQLLKTFDEFAKLADKSVEESIESECSGNLKDGYLAIIKMARDPSAFFAERIHCATACFGTHDEDLIRLLVSRSENDLKKIMQRYEEMYECNLVETVASECSGSYKHMLQMLL